MKKIILGLGFIFANIATAGTPNLVDLENIERVVDRYISTSVTTVALTSLTEYKVREVSRRSSGTNVVVMTAVTCLNKVGIGSPGGYLACTAELEEFQPGRWVISGYAACSALRRFEYEDAGSDYYRATHTIKCPGQYP